MIITKSYLRTCQEQLRLARIGYDLMDRKRIILMQELQSMIEEVKNIRGIIDEAYDKTYSLLEKANISNGSYYIKERAQEIPVDDSFKIVYRSVMGIDIPRVSVDDTYHHRPKLLMGNDDLDELYVLMHDVKQYTVLLATLDNGMYRLAKAIEKSKKRANALENIVIPDLLNKIKIIQEALEEKEREEFIRMKMVKNRKTS